MRPPRVLLSPRSRLGIRKTCIGSDCQGGHYLGWLPFSTKIFLLTPPMRAPMALSQPTLQHPILLQPTTTDILWIAQEWELRCRLERD